MIIGMTFQVLWFDDDVMSVRVQASNGLFSGTAELYEGLDLFTGLAAKISGFPTSKADSRDTELGTFNPAVGGGGAKLSLRCTDGLGHGLLSIRLRNDPKRGAGTAEFKIAVEANAIDAFVQELGAVQLEVGATAGLHGLETFALGPSEEAALLAAITEIERGEVVSAPEVISKIRGA